MEKQKKSGSAIFMYCVIGATVALSTACFTLYYGGFFKSGAILWTGVTAFTVMYHFWLRIIMGNVTKLFPIRHDQGWFKQRFFEKTLYKWLRVRKWKEKVLTYDPQAFSTKLHSLEEIANTMAKVETDHWVNVLISLSTILFGLFWGQLWIFLVTAIIGVLFDAQFIAVQRYNRPIVLRVIKRRAERAAKPV